MDTLGGLPVNIECTDIECTGTRSRTSTSCNESRPLALRDEKTAGAVTRDTAGTANERRRNLTAIRELAR